MHRIFPLKFRQADEVCKSNEVKPQLVKCGAGFQHDKGKEFLG